jgi:hypothetical protein
MKSSMKITYILFSKSVPNFNNVTTWGIPSTIKLSSEL